MNAGRLLPVLDGRDYDVVHYPATVPVPRVRDAPRVVSLLDVQHHELPQMFSALERRLRALGLRRRGARCRPRADDLRARAAGDRRACRGRARARALDRARHRPRALLAARAGAAGGLALPERYVLYPANMWPHKNHARLLEAFAALGDPELWLILTGQTYGRERLLAGRERVRHLGHVPAEQLPGLYRGATAVVHPSLFEGFGLPPLEAMACGIAVAASDRGALAEVCAGAALLFDPEDVEAIADAIGRVTADETLRARLRRAGPAHAAGFTWQAAARRHAEAYADVA